MEGCRFNLGWCRYGFTSGLDKWGGDDVGFAHVLRWEVGPTVSLGRIGPSSAGQALVNILCVEGHRDFIEKDSLDR